MATLLDELSSHLAVDIDSMDPTLARRRWEEGKPFRDMTSNQAIVFFEAEKPDKIEVLKLACGQVKDSDLELEQKVTDALDLLNVLLAREVLPYLSGRVLVQTSPTHAYNTEATVTHAKRLVALFEAHEVSPERVCVKIPSTPESILACQQLEHSGIHTLATCLFNLPQALAASQAGCTYIAPYFNELRVHFEPNLWTEYADPARDHPAGPIIGSIVQAYKKLGTKTLIMPASIVTAREATALASLHPDHLTVPVAALEQLLASPGTPLAQVTPGAYKIGAEAFCTDYLSHDAKALKETLKVDAEASRKLDDALKLFSEMEQRSRDLIRNQLASM